jgi:tetratricopeptide (TPR) repeat protein
MVGILKAKVVLIIFIILVMICTAAFGQLTALDWGNKGADLFGQGKYDEALQAFNKAIEINPQLAGAWTGKGYGLKALGRYDEAVQAFDKAIEINPQDADAWNDKGDTLKALGRTTEADVAYAKAKELTYTTSGTATASMGSAAIDVNNIRWYGYIVEYGSDKPINGARVTVTDTAGNILTDITDINGYYTLTLLKDVQYTGDVSADGYLTLPTISEFSSTQYKEKLFGPVVMRLTSQEWEKFFKTHGYWPSSS